MLTRYRPYVDMDYTESTGRPMYTAQMQPDVNGAWVKLSEVEEERSRREKPEGFYVCSFVSKEVEEDVYAEGCIGGRSCAWGNKVDLRGQTLKQLFERVESYFDFKIDELFISNPDETAVLFVGFSRMETIDCELPNKAQLEEWKAGRCKLFLVDYTFHIAFRTEQAVPMKELKECGIRLY